MQYCCTKINYCHLHSYVISNEHDFDDNVGGRQNNEVINFRSFARSGFPKVEFYS